MDQLDGWKGRKEGDRGQSGQVVVRRGRAAQLGKEGKARGFAGSVGWQVAIRRVEVAWSAD